MYKIVGSEAPEVHRHGSVKIQVLHIAVLVGKDDIVVGIKADACAFYHASEQAIAGFTHATCHGTALAHGITHLEAHHAVVALAVLG